MTIMLTFWGNTGNPSLPVVSFGGPVGGVSVPTDSFSLGPFFPTVSSYTCISFVS
jgi:hypothetical protein